MIVWHWKSAVRDWNGKCLCHRRGLRICTYGSVRVQYENEYIACGATTTANIALNVVSEKWSGWRYYGGRWRLSLARLGARYYSNILKLQRSAEMCWWLSLSLPFRIALTLTCLASVFRRRKKRYATTSFAADWRWLDKRELPILAEVHKCMCAKDMFWTFSFLINSTELWGF